MATFPPTFRVPFLDLSALHEPLKEDLLEDFRELVDSNAFINGPAVARFEQAWAEYCVRTDCVGVASGLDALRLGLLAAGIQPGDEVVVPAATFAATYEAVTQAGATPVPVDVRADDYNLDPDAAAAALSPRTSFLLPVHLYGQVCDVKLAHLAGAHGLAMLEDACQAHGATRDGVRAGSLGFAAAFSFYPGKNLGAMGDSGALVTDDAELADRVRALREHGQRAKYRHEFEGYTARLDTIQALVLLRKLERLDEWNAERKATAARYSAALEGIGDLAIPQVPAGSEPVWHLYVVRTERPEDLAEFLAADGISTGRHYPEPPHLSNAYAHLGYRRGQFPVAEKLAAQCVSLPIYPRMQREQVEAVIDAIGRYFDSA